jgi:hypothetical protein
MLKKRNKGIGPKIWYYVTVPNPNVPNAKVPNDKVPNPKMSTRHSAECTTEPNYNVPNVPQSRITTCRIDKLSNYLLQRRQIVELLITTRPYWAAHFSDNYPLRGVLRLG